MVYVPAWEGEWERVVRMWGSSMVNAIWGEGRETWGVQVDEEGL